MSLFAVGARNPDRKGICRGIVWHCLLRVPENQTGRRICGGIPGHCLLRVPETRQDGEFAGEMGHGWQKPGGKVLSGNQGHCLPRIAETRTGWGIFYAGESRVIVC
jgi:hypothetical protein